MIISHKHKFIYLHCRKTGGSSVKVSLARYLGQQDLMLGAVADCRDVGIMPPNRMLFEALQAPSFSASKLLLKGKLWKFVSASNKKKYAKLLGEQPEHARAIDVIRSFPNEWNEYTKFCIVRSPWEVMASEYFWRRRSQKHQESFEQFILSYEPVEKNEMQSRKEINWNIYSIDGKPIVDRIVRYEALKQDLMVILCNLGLDWDGWLPSAKSKSRPANVVNYRDMYNQQMFEKVRKIHRNEIEYFGFES